MILDVHYNLNIGVFLTKHTMGSRYGRLYTHAQKTVIDDAVCRVLPGVIKE